MYQCFQVFHQPALKIRRTCAVCKWSLGFVFYAYVQIRITIV